MFFFFFSSRRRHTRLTCDWSSDVCSSDLRIRELFARKGVMYVRNYGSGFDLSWEEVFQTTSKLEVESYCKSVEIDFEWLEEDQLRTRQTCQAIARHPRTGEMVWFNQAHLFHLSRLKPEIREALL